MLIRDWMTKNVLSVTPDTSMMKASKILKEHDISRLPVVDANNRVVGIVSDRDIKEASPSKATSLDVHELYYLLSEIKVKDIMTVDPVCAKPLDTVENAAVLMISKKIGGMPVVDDNNVLQGIITDSDIFEVLITITGVRYGGVQFAFELPNTPGTLKPIVDTLREHNARIISILTSMEGPEKNKESRVVNIRIMPMDRTAENKIIEELKARHKMLFWARDHVHTVS
ncbi:CBS and ACT domain-containing protein [Desulfovibrio subterraneus]|uniref:Membrane protein n=1 Tax=Desulfovibrio subterraneus TaxID=2718620 RepID=A0A7J0BGQ0_9BACT|nr:CBS and ACT domain-containing protein [Desulfovibrio subterraneus]WBF67138.1 CBS and ACT domain-containing protein [Desulfovibrio subterraneus]GFM32880.1 membrane protein [Desulfovibrio subterraneus]